MFARRSTRAYAAALVGAVLVYLAEQVLPDADARCVLADLAWTAAALGAVLGTTRALRSAQSADKLPWLFFLAGSTSWFAGQLARDLSEVGRAQLPTHAWIDAGFLLAAPLWTIGLALFLRRHGQRLALYALLLDVGAVVLTLTAGVMVYLSGLLVTAAEQDVVSAWVAVLYPLFYVAATGAALSAVWGIPLQQPRGAVTSLFVGLGLNALAFTLYLPAYLAGSFVAGTPLDPLWILGMAAIGIAGAQWVEEDSAAGAGTALSSSLIQFSRMVLPGVVAGVSAFLLVYTDVRAMPRPVADFIDASIALVVLILATRAGLSLYGNWHLGELERRRAEQMAALYDVGLATAGELSLEDLAALIAREATALTRTDGGMVALARENDFVVRAQHNAPALGLRVSVGEPLRGVALDAIRTRDLIVASDYRLHPDSNPLLHDALASAIAAPLIAHGKLVGTLTAYSRRRRVFTEETCRLVKLYAAQAAIAIANAQLVAETRRLARDDDLTGVLNRRSLMERLDTEIAAAARHGDIFGVVMCDLDGLKAVNDSAGHLVGNEVLRTVARALSESTRSEDVVARFGGDEFVLLLPRTGALPAQALVGRIAARLREANYMWAGRANPLPRVSFGIAWFPEDGRDADALLGAADARMYEDKARARGTDHAAAAEAD